MNFALFVAILFIWARPAINKALQSDVNSLLNYLVMHRRPASWRRRSISLKSKFNALDSEICGPVANAKDAAHAEAAQIISNAEQVAAHIRSEATNAAKAELDLAKANLQREIMDAVRTQVEAQLQDGQSKEKQKDLLKHQLAWVKSNALT